MSSEVRLRDIRLSDLDALFEHQCDPAALAMAAFPSRDRAAFLEHWTKNILGVDAVIKQAIEVDGRIAGYLGCFEKGGERLVGYWLGREFWGRGIATQAL